jgi:hypothetical protein
VGERKDVKKAVLWIRDPVLFKPWIRDEKKFGYGMKILDHFSGSLETIFWLKNT